jgi:hypothetical protein
MSYLIRISFHRIFSRQFPSLVTFLAPFSAIVLVIFWSLGASAMRAPIQVKPGKTSSLISDGVLSGGMAAEEFSLLGVRSEVGKQKSERVILTYGDRLGQPWKQGPGFFHIALDRAGRRMVIDLAQVHSTAVDSARLAGELRKSKLVASSEMTIDPFDRSVNITLHFKVPVQLKVSTENSNRSDVILDLQPNSGGH